MDRKYGIIKQNIRQDIAHDKFILGFFYLHGEKLTCWDLDEICTDAKIVIVEAIGHSGWVNSKVLQDFNLTDDVEDISEGLSRYDKDENGSLSSVPADYSATEFYPPESECMTIEQMLLGYTINGAKQLHLEKTKGSIEVGKDADYLVLKENLLEIPAEGMRTIIPEEVFYCKISLGARTLKPWIFVERRFFPVCLRVIRTRP